jgi:hypothetical protein
MKMFSIPLLLYGIAILLIAGCGGGEKQEKQFQESAEKEANVVFAEEFIMFLSEGNYDKAREYLDSTAKEELPASTLENTWVNLTEELGTFVEQHYDTTDKVEDYDVVYINGVFEKGKVTFQLKLNQDEEIIGFDFNQ